jgi:hemerythrin-like domain-containing protein
MTQPTAGHGVDTSDMNAVHSLFRREHRLAGDVVGRVASGDTARAAVVADHIDFVNTFLHHHHTAEDRYLWPLLLARVPDDLAPIVHLMESQHETVDTSLQQIDALLLRWRQDATAEDRDRLVALLDQLYAALEEHLSAEEEQLLPIASAALTLEEWKGLGEEALKQQDRREMPLVLGMIQYGADPETVAGMIADAPLLLRLLIPRLSRRAYRRHALAVYGTPTP